ncbi:unnamed protein product [Anisakis simplex]|uniref:IRS-type PTB domain-containing protein n=1 Tax=Anisakis simplex TaxID=6269 RepID=A0A0M3KDN5_ANISI|nr:unnamed protein product [Anisakis simplex]
MVSFEGHERGLALHVNRYCAKRIRDSLLLEHNSNTAETCNAMYFDPESQHRCEKYIVIDIKACGREDLRKLDLRLSNVQKRKADGSLMPKNANIPNEPFLQVMNAEDYEKLLNDLDVQLITSQHRASHHRGNHNLSMRHQPSNSATSTLPPPTTTTMLYTSSHSDNSNFHTPGNKVRKLSMFLAWLLA